MIDWILNITLIEFMIIVTIVSLIASIAVPAYINRNKPKEDETI